MRRGLARRKFELVAERLEALTAAVRDMEVSVDAMREALEREPEDAVCDDGLDAALEGMKEAATSAK